MRWCESRAAFKHIGTVNGKSVSLHRLMGVLYSNVANNGGDMVIDIHALAGTVTLPGTNITVPANAFNGLSVINTALTIGDRLSDMQAIADA